jgi:hypothetical protein
MWFPKFRFKAAVLRSSDAPRSLDEGVACEYSNKGMVQLTEPKIEFSYRP